MQRSSPMPIAWGNENDRLEKGLAYFLASTDQETIKSDCKAFVKDVKNALDPKKNANDIACFVRQAKQHRNNVLDGTISVTPTQNHTESNVCQDQGETQFLIE